MDALLHLGLVHKAPCRNPFISGGQGEPSRGRLGICVMQMETQTFSFEPVWVNEQRIARNMQMGRCAMTGYWSSLDDFGPLRPAGFERVVTAENVKRLCHDGRLIEAVELLGILVRADCCVSQALICTVLKKCILKKDLALSRRVHAFTVRIGHESDPFVCNHILRMYASIGRLEDAMDVFTMVAKRDAFMWSSIISAHVNHGQDRRAVRLYHEMRRSNVEPDCHVFVAALQACARGTDLKSGQQVHADVLASGVDPDLFVSSSLVDMYAKCGSLEEAQLVFDGIRDKDVVTWNAMIAGYSQQGMGQEAFRLYSAMQEDDVAADSVTFVCLLQACASVGNHALEMGKQLHAQINERGLQAHVFIANSLVHMYAKCGSLENAQDLFDRLGQKDAVTWTALISGYSKNGMGQEALRLYRAMEEDGVTAPDSATFVCLLQACASVGTSALEKGKQFHSQIRERGYESDVLVAGSLVNMYAKCGSMEEAWRLFEGLDHKNVVTWTALISGCSQQGRGQLALHLHGAMQEVGITVPNAVTYTCLLQACASVGSHALEKGKLLHAQIREQGLEADGLVANSLVNMYAKCGSLEDARKVFDGLDQKNVVTWTVLIAGYSQQGMEQEALRLYGAMQDEGTAVSNAVTFMCLLQACANVAALHRGRQLHAQIEERGLPVDACLAGSLINMYGKSGSVVEAQQVFDATPERDVVAWSALIAGYTCQGDSEAVFDLVQRMGEDGIQPVGITFLSVLTVCSHMGLVTQGKHYFEAMTRHYSITPTLEHYTCMVDLLGRARQLDEALALVRIMHIPPNAAIWHTLLSACSKWSNVEVGRHAFDEAVKVDHKDAVAHVLMSNIYAGARMLDQAHEMQARRMKIRAWKQPGQSWWTDGEGRVHSFLVE